MNDLNTEHQDDTILILVIVIYIYISQFNSIFKYCQQNPFESIDDICDEFTLRDLLLSIEPKLDKVELSKDVDYGVRYGNFVALLNSVMKYISNHNDHESFSSLTDFKSQLNINDIIKNERKESLQLLEMVIFISGISSNKEHLDLLEGCNENCISLYLSITEKYMQKYEMTQPDERSSVTRKTNDGYKANDELYRELDEKTNLVNNLTKAKCELEINYKEVCDKLKNIQISNEELEAVLDRL